MKKKAVLLIGIILLLGLIPVISATATPPAARQSFLTVGDWNLGDNLEGFIHFSAEDVNWQVTKAARLTFGFEYCEGATCIETVDISLAINTRDYRYPQNLDLTAPDWRYVTPSGDTVCSVTQFVRILDSAGAVKKEATNGPFALCVSAPPYPVP